MRRTAVKLLNGPTRMLVFNSGKYDFAELDLTKPLHLVGPNNIGKTSLIAMLQFLYIDSQKQMEFSSDLRTSRRYYFPESSSYMLFEVNTPSGFMVVGIHGLGAVRQFDFERFCYRGTLSTQDYLSENGHILDADAIKASLASREYRKLEPRQLQGALTGAGATGIDLGLLPLRQRGQYEPFRTLLKKLLNLAHLKQDELKDAFLQVYGAAFQQRVVDLSGNYSEPYSQFIRKKQEVDALKQSRPMIETALKHVQEREQARSKAAALWQLIQQQYKQDKEAQEHQRSQLEVREIDHKTTHTDLCNAREDLVGKERALDKKLTKWELKLEELAKLGEALKGFEPDIEAARLQNLKSRIGQVMSSLNGAKKNPDALQQQQQRLQKKQRALINLLEHSEDMAAHILAQSMDAQDLESVFRVLNPDMLHLRRGDGLDITDAEQLVSTLKTILSDIDDETFSAHGVSIDLSRLSGLEMNKLNDPEQLRQQLEAVSGELDEITAALEAARNRRQIEDELKTLEEERDGITIRQNKWTEYQAQLIQQDEWKKEQNHCRQSLIRTGNQLHQLDESIQRKNEQLQQCTTSIENLKGSLAALEQSMRNLKMPDDAWPADPDVQGSRDFRLNIAEYNEAFHHAMELHQHVCEQRNIIEQQTYDRFPSGDEAKWIAAMQDELEGLNKKEEAVNHIWQGIIVSMRKDFKALHQDLDVMNSHITSFNKTIAKLNVSNLKLLQIRMSRRESLAAPIERLIDEDETPLLAGQTTVIDSLGEMLQKQPKIYLEDLFDLSFIVEIEGAKKKTYKHLDSIESHGTTITIKVLVHLILIHGLMAHKVRLPFYLDEAASLDPDNLRGIIKQAVKLGFVPMLASPDGMDVAENLYFIQERSGRIVLNQHAKITIAEYEPGL